MNLSYYLQAEMAASEKVFKVLRNKKTLANINNNKLFPLILALVTNNKDGL